ncbi:MAG TPA: hypothetical protein VFR23_05695 [Jiangellaceae bacterium]|nr:hypothetical protein [Jiangellaceae bacterium]
MSVAKKLQIKSGQSVAVLRKPADVSLDIEPGDVVDGSASAEAALVFVMSKADLASSDVEAVLEAARRDALSWIAYPKAGQLGTDLNRDSLSASMSGRGVRPVRQVSIDDVWSALRFRPDS